MACLHHKPYILRFSKEVLSQYAVSLCHDMVLYRHPFLWKMTVWVQPSRYSIHHPLDTSSSRPPPLWDCSWSKWYQKYHSGNKVQKKRHFCSKWVDKLRTCISFYSLYWRDTRILLSSGFRLVLKCEKESVKYKEPSDFSGSLCRFFWQRQNEQWKRYFCGPCIPVKL